MKWVIIESLPEIKIEDKLFAGILYYINFILKSCHFMYFIKCTNNFFI